MVREGSYQQHPRASKRAAAINSRRVAGPNAADRSPELEPLFEPGGVPVNRRKILPRIMMSVVACMAPRGQIWTGHGRFTRTRWICEKKITMSADQQPIILLPGKGRSYACGPMTAVFKADGAETAERYSVSEWIIAPHSPGSGPHAHEKNEELFFVSNGVLAIRVGDEWIDAPRGTFIRIPAGVMHDFENRSDHEAALFNVYLPGSFEPMMPSIVAWFANQDHRTEAPPPAVDPPSATTPASVEVNLARHFLRGRFCGIVRPEHMKAASDDAQKLLPGLAPGFVLITDLTGLEEMHLDCVPHLAAIMDQCLAAGVGKVVRIIPDPSKDIGLNLLSLTHYRGKVPIVVVANAADAEKEIAAS